MEPVIYTCTVRSAVRNQFEMRTVFVYCVHLYTMEIEMSISVIFLFSSWKYYGQQREDHIDGHHNTSLLSSSHEPPKCLYKRSVEISFPQLKLRILKIKDFGLRKWKYTKDTIWDWEFWQFWSRYKWSNKTWEYPHIYFKVRKI